MSKIIPTMRVTEIDGDSDLVLKINKCDFDKSKYKAVRQSLENKSEKNSKDKVAGAAKKKDTGK